ncbi:MAG: ferric iron uptake transcriptional regulator [Gammaproteobacteria bacterium]|nr:ferric iron uptake transcriptional regulator [Gammaproteobacteria bacterium]
MRSHLKASACVPISGSITGKELQKAGLKITLPRLRVLEIFEDSDERHLSAEDVYRKVLDSDASIGLATIYRVLTQFESAGILDRHNFDDGHAVYELASIDHHDHMVDVDSGEVIEFVNHDIEALQREIAEQHGYDLVDHALVLYVRKRA